MSNTTTMNDAQFTTLAEVEAAHLAGKTVHWKNLGYQVTGKAGDLMVLCSMNGCAFGLTKSYKPSDFFTA
jgi:hypothetical protein